MRKYIDYLNGAIVLVMFFTILFQIVARLILKYPTTWSVEVGNCLFTFVVFIGVASITRERAHLKVDFLYNMFPPLLKRFVDFTCSLLFLGFFAFFAIGAYRNIVDNWDVDIPSVEWANVGSVYLIIFLATLLNIFYLVLNMIDDVRGVPVGQDAEVR